MSRILKNPPLFSPTLALQFIAPSGMQIEVALTYSLSAMCFTVCSTNACSGTLSPHSGWTEWARLKSAPKLLDVGNVTPNYY